MSLLIASGLRGIASWTSTSSPAILLTTARSTSLGRRLTKPEILGSGPLVVKVFRKRDA